MEPKKYQYVDSLRGIAILLVMLLHISQAGYAHLLFPEFLSEFTDNGQYGVQLFFIVSAYTLMMSYYSRREEQFATRNFFIRRFFRIAPLYYTALAYYLFQNFIGFDAFHTGQSAQPISSKEVIANLLFINSLSPDWINHLVPGGWSVTIEFTFYFMLPFICKRVRNINDSIILVCITMLLATVLHLHHLLGNSSLNRHNFLYWYLPNQFPVFAIGIFSYYALHTSYQLKPIAFLTIAATAFLFCYLTIPVHFICSLSFGFLLMALAKQELPLLVNRFTAYIGKLSFSLYLVHFAVIYWLAHFHCIDLIKPVSTATAILNLLLKYVIAGSLSVFISHFTYRLIEQKFQQIGKRFIKK